MDVQVITDESELDVQVITDESGMDVQFITDGSGPDVQNMTDGSGPDVQDITDGSGLAVQHFKMRQDWLLRTSQSRTGCSGQQRWDRIAVDTLGFITRAATAFGGHRQTTCLKSWERSGQCPTLSQKTTTF